MEKHMRLNELNIGIDKLCDLNINPTQYLACYLVFMQDQKSLIKYTSKKGVFNREDIDDLIERGILFNTEVEKVNYFLTKMIVNPKFIEEMFITEEDFDEVFESYPAFYKLNGTNIALRGCDRDKLAQYYTKKIKHAKKAHKEVLEIIVKYKKLLEQNKISFYKLENFIMDGIFLEIGNLEESVNTSGYGENAI